MYHKPMPRRGDLMTAQIGTPRHDVTVLVLNVSILNDEIKYIHVMPTRPWSDVNFCIASLQHFYEWMNSTSTHNLEVTPRRVRYHEPV